MMRFAFVLLSYAENEAAGMERATAGLVLGLHAIGHEAYVIAAGPPRNDDASYVFRLGSLHLTNPSTDEQLLDAIAASPGVWRELDDLTERYGFDVVCWTDALWGLGSFGRPRGSRATVLMIHVLGDIDRLLQAIENKPNIVLTPSEFLVEAGSEADLTTEIWRVLPNPLLQVPDAPDIATRRDRFTKGPLRAVCRLGPEKGALEAIQSYPSPAGRRLEIVLAKAPFELSSGSQERLLLACQQAAAGRNVTLMPALHWNAVQGFLRGASIAVVPSKAETFGLVALEALSVGTPVAAFSVGNLPHLLPEQSPTTDPDLGMDGLWAACEVLLADEGAYLRASASSASRASHFAPAKIAEMFVAMIG